MLEQATRLVRWLVDPLVRFNFLDRSLALGSQAFGGLIPLLILLEAAQPGTRSVASDLIERFDLQGDAADTVREVFATPTDEPTTTSLSVVLLIVSVLSFTRRLQRLYEGTWELEERGVRGTGSGLAWIAFIALYGSLHPVLDEVVGGLPGLALSLAGALLVGFLTPYVLLGRRLPWRRLMPQALLTAAGLEALGIWSAIYMPRAIESSASAYGGIGVALAMLTWLWGLGIVFVIAAVYGSPQMQWRSMFGSPGAGDGARRPAG
ncbi:MAG TPA: YhjD/YihY/BrkB family envelope integrity protein [Solirubrobacteraceae bacterium]|nr:YhjD/YihY/BrkB family envelope integrity protein [Solirubrobacteraceae bacterium]